MLAVLARLTLKRYLFLFLCFSCTPCTGTQKNWQYKMSLASFSQSGVVNIVKLAASVSHN
jgi:hypothetical protein